MALRRLIAFDLDGTLAPSKSPLPDRMSNCLNLLLDKYEVLVMSGGKFEQFKIQLLNNLQIETEKLVKLHLMPTCGTRYHQYQNGKWNQIYAEDFTEVKKQKIISALNKGIDQLGLREKKIWGEIIEDRGSQITFSALGQDIVAKLGIEGVKLKEQWDPTSEKKHKLRDYVADLIPEFEVRVGGGTSIDVTKPGIDKAYGMKKLLKMRGLQKEDILFIGDRLEEGGNDYPIKQMGVDCMHINSWEQTALVIEAIVNIS